MESNLTNPRRLVTLRQTGLLDSPPEEAFDRITRLAARMLDVPIVLVSLVDEARQFFKSQVGLPPALAIPRQTSLDLSFCKYVVMTGEPLIVSDSRVHPLLKDNPVIAHGVVAYAGIPLMTQEGLILGSFCAIDTKPCDWTDRQINDLRDFAATAMTEIELRRTNSSKDRFIAMLSHELRTPLSPALMAAAEMAGNDKLPPNFREDADLIRRNIEFEVRMIDDLLDVTRIASGKLVLDLAELDLHQVLADAVAMCRPFATVKNSSIQLNLHATDHFCRGDRTKLQQAFCNLINNGIKFSPQNGSVEVASTSDDGVVEITVSDSGVGIPEAAIPSLFDPFQQGGSQVTKRFGGLGLGLAICKGVVDEHEGSIIAISGGPDLGSRFIVRLPTVVQASCKAAIETMPATGPKNLDILLVEDHEDTSRMMARLLKRNGHRVVTATTLASAVDAGTRQRFDLLMSDLGLPDGSGLELVQRLGDHCPPNGIALTGFGMEEDIQRTRAAGFQRHLTKPIRFDELISAIQEIASS